MDWTEHFTGLSRLEPDVRRELVARSRVVSFPAGSTIFAPGKSNDSLLLLITGTVRVQQTSDSGREIVLFRVQAGDSCVMTTASLLGHHDHSAEGIAETGVTAAAIPRAVFDDLLGSSAGFRRFVFDAYGRRMADLFLTIEEIAFRRVDIRLAQRLLHLARDGHLKATHAQLATELGTAREVVSRQLAEFQRRGWVELSRGDIRLTERAGLEELATA